MILTSLTNADFYGSLHPRLAQGIAYLKSGAWQGKAPGTYVLEDDALTAMIQHYDTIQPDEARWEAHRVYTDIQFVISGRERIAVGVLENFTTTVDYNTEKDIAFFDGSGDAVDLEAGMLTILFPHDVHKPRLTAGEQSQVEKIVLKVRLD
jgi:YhcH/YjgK/YiaL family protein